MKKNINYNDYLKNYKNKYNIQKQDRFQEINNIINELINEEIYFNKRIKELEEEKKGSK